MLNRPARLRARRRSHCGLFFVFGTHIFQYGTDLFRYDHTARTLTVTHNAHDDINAIAFSRRDPKLMYLGLEAAD